MPRKPTLKKALIQRIKHEECNNKGLLTEREVCAVQYRGEVFHGTDRTSGISKLFIIWLAVIFRDSVTFRI